MGKKIEPIYGLPIEEVLKLSSEDLNHAINSQQLFVKDREFDAKAKLTRERLRKVSNILLASTNSDACLTLAQTSLLYTEIANMITSDLGKESNSVIREIATHINSLRLSCENCLNKECPQRDPSLEK